MKSEAIASLLSASASRRDVLKARGMGAVPPHFRPQAKRWIHFFGSGAPSRVGMFDPRRTLETERKTGAALKSDFSFKRKQRGMLEDTSRAGSIGSRTFAGLWRTTIIA